MKLYMSSLEHEKGDFEERNTYDAYYQEKQKEKSFDERIREMAPRNINTTERSSIQKQVMELEFSKRPVTSKPTVPANAPKPRPTQPVDEKTIMRKAIGAIVKYFIKNYFNYINILGSFGIDL